MKKYFKIGLLILLAIFLILQLIRPAKNKGIVIAANNIKSQVVMDSSVQKILSKACYDCHSNNSNYPWYAEIMPVGWFLSNHIKEGKSHFNFDEFATYKPKKALHKLEEIAETVNEGSMPMNSYTKMHSEAKLTADEKNIIINWANNARTILKAKYERDSISIK